jgi:short-subunit dehydrogenase
VPMASTTRLDEAGRDPEEAIMEIRDTRVLLTGATGGIGHAIARRLAAEGAHLVLTGRKADVLAELAAELGAEVIACDLADRHAVEDLVAKSSDTDILVNNAALPATGHFLDLSVEQIDRILDVNLRAPIVLTRGIATAMAERRRGHVVFISSLSGKAGSPLSSLYNATKFGLRGLGQGLRHDLGDRGVGVSVVFPGFIRDAGMFADAGATLPPGVGTSTPEEVADAVAGAITRDRGEVDVAPLPMRLASTMAGVFPGLAHTLTERYGSGVAEQLTAGQADKR